MTRHLGLLLTALAATLVVAACGPATAGARGGSTKVFYVSPAGDDSSSGSRAAPFRTLERARRAARGVDRRRSAVEIRLRKGSSRLRSPLQLNAGDSGTAGHEVVWRAAPGEHPVISGGVRVRGWSLFDADKHIYRARVQGLKTRQLYVNGRRAIRARTKL